MPADVEEELLRSIDDVDSQIRTFRKKVRAVLMAAQTDAESATGSAGQETP